MLPTIGVIPHPHYLAAVRYLEERPIEIRGAWSESKSHPAGILFGMCHPDRNISDADIGCLTLVRLDDSTFEHRLEAEIKSDERLPKSSSKIKVEHLRTFAEWQTVLDAEYGREPPLLHPELVPYLQGG